MNGLHLNTPRLTQAPFASCYAPNGHTYSGIEITSDTGIHVRDGAKLHFFAGKYWLLGGWWSTPVPAWNNGLTTNEVWSSPDAATWTLELPHDEDPPVSGPCARWRKRHNFGSLLLNYDDDEYLWVVGGDHLDGATTPSDVWRSPDGRTWERVAASSPFGPRRLPIVGNYRGQIHVCGGQQGPLNISTADHFSSANGVDWVKHPDMPFTRAGVTQLASLCDKLVIVAGFSNNEPTPVYNRDVWAWNGSVWARQCERIPTFGRLWNGVVPYDEKLWLAAGRIGEGTDINDCLHSEDLGRTWKQFPAPWPNTHADGIVATEEGGICMVSGYGIGRKAYRIEKV